MPVAAADTDPISVYLRAAERARSEGVDTVPAALATADPSGRPAVRVVLLRHIDQRGFVFFTNYQSRKAREVTENPRAALCQHWPTLEEQVRIEGSVERIDAAESDAYFAGRPRESQVGAWASDQSRPLDARNAPSLLGRVQDHPRRDGILVRAHRSPARASALHPFRRGMAERLSLSISPEP